MRTRLATTAAVAVLVLLGGCAQKTQAPTPPAGSPAVSDAWTSCPEHVGDQGFGGAEPLSLPRLPARFSPAAVVVCAVEARPRADGGEDLVLVERRGTGVAALTDALRLPDEPLTGAACTDDLPGVPWFALFDAGGRWLRPGVPQDGCGKLRIEVREAVRLLELAVVATTVLRETVSSAAAASGCSQQWADMVSVTAGDPPRQERPFELPKSEMRLCLYTVPPAEQGSGKPAGDFERGGALPAQRWTELRQAMQGAGPAAPCAAHASRFALFRPANGATGADGEVYVELDGCRRILVTPASGGAALRQGDATLANRIDRALG